MARDSPFGRFQLQMRPTLVQHKFPVLLASFLPDYCDMIVHLSTIQVYSPV